MTVTERLMGVGSWDLRLRDDLPSWLRAALDPERGGWGFAQLVITDVQIRPETMTDRGVLRAARYTGVYRTHTEGGISGGGLPLLLGDEEGKGNILEAEIAGTYDANTWATTLVQWSGLSVRGVQAGGNWTSAFRWVTCRKALDEVCAHYGHEWRITPDLGYYQGSLAYLYPEVPLLLVTADDAGGVQQGLVVVRGSVSTSVDVEDYANKLIYLTAREKPAEPAQWTIASRSDNYRDPKGRPLNMEALVEAHLDDGDRTTLAAAELGKKTVRRSWEVTAEHVPHVMTVGAPVWVWSPADDVYDLSQQVIVRGRTIYPARSRLMGATWPVTAGMGVYLRRRQTNDSDAEYLDLSQWVAPETGAVKLEVGAVPRPTR